MIQKNIQRTFKYGKKYIKMYEWHSRICREFDNKRHRLYRHLAMNLVTKKVSPSWGIIKHQSGLLPCCFHCFQCGYKFHQNCTVPYTFKTLFPEKQNGHSIYVEHSFTTIFKKSKESALYVDHSFKKLVLYKGGGVWEAQVFVFFFGNHFFVLKTSRNALKHMTSSFKLKGDVISGCYDSKKIPWIRSVLGLTTGSQES